MKLITKLSIAFAIIAGLGVATVCYHRWARKQPPILPFTVKVVEIVPHAELLATKLQNYVPPVQHHLVVVIPSYNNAKYYMSNLDSVYGQDYENYSVVYIDDASPDKTGELVSAYVKKHGQQHRTKLVVNPVNQGACANLYHAITGLSPEAIVVILDGDDWLAKPDVLSLVNKIYNKYDVLMTHGSYQYFPYKGRKALYCESFPDHVITNNQFRGHEWVTGHLRTFKASLFHRIKKEDLMHDGSFFPVVYDVAMLLPMLEMAGNRSLFVPDVLYLYNYITPFSDNRLHEKKCAFFNTLIRKKAAYAPVAFE